MNAAARAVVEFVEGPTVGGSRDWPVEAVFELFSDPKTILPDLGVAPNALLKAAMSRSTPTLPDGGYPTVNEWLSVRDTCYVFAFNWRSYGGMQLSPTPVGVACELTCQWVFGFLTPSQLSLIFWVNV